MILQEYSIITNIIVQNMQLFSDYELLVEPVPTAGTSLSQLKCKRIHPPNNTHSIFV